MSKKRGLVEKERVICHNCRYQYSFLYEAREAMPQVQPTLEGHLGNYLNKRESYRPCPHCGFVQEWMVATQRKRRLADFVLFTLFGLAGVLLYLVYQMLAVALNPLESGGFAPVHQAEWILDGESALGRILYHEYAHAVLYYLTRHNIPTWLNEGLAQYCEPNSESSSREERQVREWIENRQYIPMTRLENSFLDFSSERAQQAYQESRLFVRFLVERFGEYAMRDLLRKLGRGLDMEQAAQSAYGDSVSGLEQQWIREMR